MKKNIKKMTFAERAKTILQKEADPKLQMDLLEALAKEQEQYKIKNNISDFNSNEEFGNGGDFSFNPNEFVEDELSRNLDYASILNDATPLDRNSKILNAKIDLESRGIKFNKNFNTPERQVPQNPSVSNRLDSWWGKNNPVAASAAGFGLQIAPSVASGIISSIGNRKMYEDYDDLAEGMKGKYSHVKAALQSPEQISLERERSTARKEASDIKGAAFYDLKNTARTRGEYMVGASNLTSKIQRNLSNTLSGSYQNEAQMNAAERARVGAANAQAMMSTSQFNAQQDANNLRDYYNLKGQALGYKAGQYNIWQGVGQDIMKISNQNQMISSLGDHYGYTRPKWYQPNQWSVRYRNEE